MKKYLLFIIAITFFSNCIAQQPNPKVWTKKYEGSIYNAIYEVANSLFSSEDQKKDYVNYCVEKLKEKFPNGADNIPEDSLKNAMYLIGASYSRNAKYLTFKHWTPEYEKIIKTDLLYNPSLKEFNDKTKVFFCDCYVSNLKKIFPNGVSQRVTKDVQTKIANICMQEIAKNVKYLKN